MLILSRSILLICLFIWFKSGQLLCQDSDIEKKIDLLISQMTLKEKIGQLVLWNGSNVEGERRLRNGLIGAFLNIRNQEEIHRLQQVAIEETRLGIPIMVGNDVIHGYHTTFPVPLAWAASWDLDLIKKAAQIAAWEAAENGTHWTFAPMVDIARDPRWGRIVEGAGEDPFLGSMIAKAMVEGFQGKNLKHKKTIAACAKHYVAYGAAIAGKDYNSVDISERSLREIFLPPFQSAVKAGVSTIMTAFNDLNGIPASANFFTLTNILRNEWGFNGFVVGDYNALGELVNHGVAEHKSEAAWKALDAGVDMDMVGDTIIGDVYSPFLESLVKNGKISEKRIDMSVRRILRIKHKLDLFDNPFIDPDYFRENSISEAEKKETARQLARESIVLLKNDHNILPLGKNIKSIAIIGPLAHNQSEMLGPWSCEAMPEKVVTILQGIQQKVSSLTAIKYVKGCDIQGNDSSQFEKAVQVAKEAEVTILAVGESNQMSGEAASRTNIHLPGIQTKLIKRIHATDVPLIAIVMSGRPLILNWLAENVSAIIQAWFLGDQAGNAIADVLLGDYNPSGKLPVTFPRSVGQIPIYYNFKATGRPYNPNYKFTTKYIDSPVNPLFPFGYGLSYTTFVYSDLKLSKVKVQQNEPVKATVKVTNTGMREGTEIVQFYIHDIVASVTRPMKELKRFQKIRLKPGETKFVIFEITPKMLSFHDINLKKVIEPGMFEIIVGGNSVDVISTKFELIK